MVDGGAPLIAAPVRQPTLEEEPADENQVARAMARNARSGERKKARPLSRRRTQILATESCVGCHSSAGIWTSHDPPTQSGQLTADFSWLMAQKAQWAPP
jgi:hypothetical protein